MQVLLFDIDGTLVYTGGAGREAVRSALAEEFGVVADVWSATSFTELRRDGEAVARHNRLNPDQEQKCWVGQCLEGREGPAREQEEQNDPEAAARSHEKFFRLKITIAAPMKIDEIRAA